MGLIGDAHALQVLHGFGFRLAARPLLHPDRRQTAVLEHRQVREQVEVLEHHADVATDRLDLLDVLGQRHAVDHDIAFLMLLKMIDAADHRRLAGPRRATDDDTFALAHAQVDVTQHVEVAVPLVETLELDHRALIGAGVALRGGCCRCHDEDSLAP